MATASRSSCMKNNALLAQKNEANESMNIVDRNSVKTLNTNRVQGDQNCNSLNGMTCHQCRQKILNIAALELCTNIKKNDTVKKLRMLNAKKLDEMQGNCNCSICMKTKGPEPTDPLASTAKAKGFKSVSGMLQVQGPEKSESASWKKPAASDKEGAVQGKEKSVDRSVDYEEQDIKRMKREGLTLLTEIGNGSTDDAKAKGKALKAARKPEEGSTNKKKKEVDLEHPLPQGNLLTAVEGIELAPWDVGDALQFLQFFETFGEFFKFNDNDAECVLRELRRGSGRIGRPGQYSSIIQFHVQLLSFIQRGKVEESSSSEQTSYNNSWFQDVRERLAKSRDPELDNVLKELPQECGGDGYNTLSFSQELRILNFLCHGALSTREMRSWMDKQAEMSVQTQREARVKVAAAKKKEKLLKRNLQDEKKKSSDNAAEPASTSKHEATVSQIQTAVDLAHAELVEATAMIPKDLGTWDASPLKEKWYYYGADTKESLAKYLAADVKKRLGESGQLHQTEKNCGPQPF